MEDRNLCYGYSLERERKTKTVYELCADVAFEFKNGDEIRISKTMISLRSQFFSDVFFGPTSTARFRIEHFDSEIFKTFLDCLFGLQEYTASNSLSIYPIAHCYQVKESLEKCVDALEPKVLNENVALALNLALLYENDALVKNVINFIRVENGFVDFIENENYRNLLEPKSMCRLLEEVNVDSFVWRIIYDWGVNYLKRHRNPIDICCFFKDNGIFVEILHDFESIQAVTDFHEMTGRQFLDLETLNTFLQFQTDSALKKPNKSEWVKLDGNARICEKIKFIRPFIFSTDKQEKGLFLRIRTNRIFYENISQNNQLSLKTEVKYSFRSISLSVADCWNERHETSCKSKNLHESCTCFIPLKVSSNGYLLAKGELNNFSGELRFRVRVGELQNQFLEIESVDVTYVFQNVYKARILKTTLSENFEDCDKLYLTKSVFIEN